MDASDEVKSLQKECVKVAVNIRPLIASELALGCTDCVAVVPGEPQVQIGAHCFTYDYVYGSLGTSSSNIFEECVAPLVDAVLHGYNATVLAYGQTGSGKTYTMGTNFSGEGSNGDQETTSGGIILAGVTEAEVRSKDEMALYLTRGSQSRATGSTNMNSQSSRSHAIFTICLEQKRNANCSGDGSITNGFDDDILFAKLHLVDLAGSERAKRTGADGLRFKEGIHINKGLLALGNVISALGDDKKRKDGGHVPYRDSKLTRLLQDSLGGNSKTIMIACISPADVNAEETINTLKYANRARNIQNKAVINRDPTTVEIQKLRSQLEQLQSEVLFYRGGGAPFEELQVLRERISLLEASNAELHHELKERQITCDQLSKRALDAQLHGGKPWEEIDGIENRKLDLLNGYATRIQELEAELMRAQNSCNPDRNAFVDCLAFAKDPFFPSLNDIRLMSDGMSRDYSSEADEDENESEHSSLQGRLGKELQELDKRLEQKEAEMKRFSKMDTSILRQHYEKKLLELEQEKKALQKEIEELDLTLQAYLPHQVSELKKKQEAQSQLLRQKQKSDDAAKRLQEEIQRIKSQKESEQFRSWKTSREKEVLQLKKEGRRNEYEMHKLLALNHRQKMVVDMSMVLEISIVGSLGAALVKEKREKVLMKTFGGRS
ncbi:hypothetical protein HPP92_010653 [Vanilla planifolia]|uniref:Kinesin-like protein n=1 Tax=Vanilla planifolia TaxID=51239 RepID=A0A835R1B8_VANPL|nr:hypothetical protein HPP92_010653 [Vanilla planifolia]